ncbi:MAG: DEAD/DEAH box helicase family protein [Chloroflexaceae bacterium]|nr:DEAD/DEAH box helicase family protein [Chloroflexaceae bacterium]
MSEPPAVKCYRVYHLIKARQNRSQKVPAAHQNSSLGKLRGWFEGKPSPSGGILVLPTGAGKTFTAVRFLCEKPLSGGYKVLWLAHTHHLLEQALESFGPGNETIGRNTGYEVGRIDEPKTHLRVRVVSGAPGHWPVKTISPDDDVLICTLQTVIRAYWQEHPTIKAWLESARGKLFIVFDEAHHSPAPGYRTFVNALRQQYPGLSLLGLTATPTYTDSKKQGWLSRLFPQGIIHQEKITDLIANRILAQPVLEQYPTEFHPEFDEREYQKWVGTYRDIPEYVISKLAESRERNMRIASTYVNNKEKFGKTIIFADRWFQCDQLREFLHQRDPSIRADVIYSHVDANPGSVEARNERTRDENTKVLEAFRRGELDVLINVRMLTEGTDVPDAQTVFLTRQTTSSILLTQMIGRALRGPAFGGTEKAYIVSFIDDWRHLINWAEWEQIAEGIADDGVPERGERPPLYLISIELVRQLNRQMDSGVNIALKPFLSLMPIGWYLVQFQTLVRDESGAETDNLEEVQQLVMVYDNEEQGYGNYIEHLKTADIAAFTDVGALLEDYSNTLQTWLEHFFGGVDDPMGGDLRRNLWHIARHMAQEERTPPTFFRFEERNHHDLDALAQKAIDENHTVRQIRQMLEQEYRRTDCYWEIIYPSYGLFKSQFDACMNRIFEIGSPPHPDKGNPGVVNGSDPRPTEPSEAVKQQVKQRDGYRCLCCGETNRRLLQVDHVAPSYLGGDNSLGNLQTLCGYCNRHKGISEINFRHNCTLLSQPPENLPLLDYPGMYEASELDVWETFLRRIINFFYRCAAVESVTIKSRGEYFWNWHISLYEGNNPRWLERYLGYLLGKIREARDDAGCQGPEQLTIVAPDLPKITYPPVPVSGGSRTR